MSFDQMKHICITEFHAEETDKYDEFTGQLWLDSESQYVYTETVKCSDGTITLDPLLYGPACILEFNRNKQQYSNN